MGETPDNPVIRRLPPLLVNQIAAGEVVERPASVVKELVENALDAGARRITVELEQGGIELIRITDDGCGMGQEDLPLALATHATSKIAEADDLDHVATLGFRGEALASIASVARMEIRSRRAIDEGACVIRAEGDQIEPVQPASGAVGTRITVRNLFFNTPARRKFLKTANTERGHAVDAVRNLAMANPAVGFRAVCDGRPVLDVPEGQTPRQRVLALLGEELADQFVEVHADEFDDARGLAIWGMAGLPILAKATAKAQHVLLNGRPIRDKTITHALKEAYRGLIEPGRHPTVVLMIEMDPSSVDVNVHPAKTEVRFRDSSLVHQVVLRAVRDALRSADLTPAMTNAGTTTGGVTPHQAMPGGGAGGHGYGGGRGGNGGGGGGGGGGAFVDYFKRQVPAQTGGRLSYEALREALERVPPPPLPSPESEIEEPPSPDPALPVPEPAKAHIQIHKSYVVTQDEQGLVIVDQHALHERAMFELFMARLERGDLESQRLITPVVVGATAQQVDRLADLAGLLTRIGIEAEPMGPASIAVHAFPTLLFDKGVDPLRFMTELFERTDDEGFVPNSEEALHEVVDMMSCKAAIKAGDQLGEAEIESLLNLRGDIERSSNCPHGRPTSIRLSIDELNRRFGRS